MNQTETYTVLLLFLYKTHQHFKTCTQSNLEMSTCPTVVIHPYKPSPFLFLTDAETLSESTDKPQPLLITAKLTLYLPAFIILSS